MARSRPERHCYPSTSGEHSTPAGGQGAAYRRACDVRSLVPAVKYGRRVSESPRADWYSPATAADPETSWASTVAPPGSNSSNASIPQLLVVALPGLSQLTLMVGADDNSCRYVQVTAMLPPDPRTDVSRTSRLPTSGQVKADS